MKKFFKRPRAKPEENLDLENWVPKTELGRQVKDGNITKITDILFSSKKILEKEITETLIPDLQVEFVNLGQAKGKFGGGRRKNSKQTQKITKEGGIMSFSMLAICGDKNGIVGMGYGKARETIPARDKTLKKVKTNLISIRRGSGSWESFGAGAHTLPFAIEGKCGSCKVKFMPAPKGTGLVVEKELKTLLELAGIKDIWSKTLGQTKNKINLIKAGFDALKNLQKVKLTSRTKVGRNLMEANKDE